MRSIGLDVHRDFCEVAISEGGRARSVGRVATTPEQLELFAGREVVLAHPKPPRAISHAKVKSDKFDARMLAELLAADLIPFEMPSDVAA